jgi:hypothetical protein
MVPRIPCELSALASDNPPINIKAHSKVRAFCFALIILLSCVWLRHPNPGHFQIGGNKSRTAYTINPSAWQERF